MADSGGMPFVGEGGNDVSLGSTGTDASASMPRGLQHAGRIARHGGWHGPELPCGWRCRAPPPAWCTPMPMGVLLMLRRPLLLRLLLLPLLLLSLLPCLLMMLLPPPEAAFAADSYVGPTCVVVPSCVPPDNTGRPTEFMSAHGW